jgi:hypothetical protein
MTSRAFLTFVAIDRDGAPLEGAAAAGGDGRGARVCEEAPRARGAKRGESKRKSNAEALGEGALSVESLRHLLEAEHRPFEVDADAVLAQELVADDAAKLEARAARSARSDSVRPPGSFL